RRRHTRSLRDWSSDVCSSDLAIGAFWAGHHRAFDCARHWSPALFAPNLLMLSTIAAMPFFTAFSAEYFGHRVPTAFYCGWMVLRSEERRVGKECRAWWALCP